MITAIDTNVLLDVCLPDPRFGADSKERLRECLAQGAGIICEVVYAELACAFPSHEGLQETLKFLGVELEPSKEKTLWVAAGMWQVASREKRGRRGRILPDFLIGAHGLTQADRLLTRDRGFYSAYFKALRILSP